MVDCLSFREALDSLVEHAASGGAPAFVVTPNAQHIVLLERDARFGEVYRHADLVVPDGYSLLAAAHLLGSAFPERVAGVDLFQALCSKAVEHGLRIFLLGGRPGAAELAICMMRRNSPGLQAATYCPPLGFENSELELARVAKQVTEFQPDLLFVALGAPKQEYWIHEHGRHLGASVCVGVGGSFEMVSGLVPRAPRWIQNIGCEWLYRLCLEPRRMWRRYLIGNIEFAWIILRQLRAGGINKLPPNVRTTSMGEPYR
jgi:N-acetylglucosaminyldiphosphoundecaprenol N-acetyl-beta-D-mannosaminyltransferase